MPFLLVVEIIHDHLVCFLALASRHDDGDAPALERNEQLLPVESSIEHRVFNGESCILELPDRFGE